MTLFNFLRILVLAAFTYEKETADHYYIQFERIDNRADILVNDSLVYSSGTIDHNPELNELHRIYLGGFLTEKEDKVVVRVYNGHEPYQNEEDLHWEIKYLILDGDETVESVWEYEDDGEIGVVFEMEHYL